AERGIDTSGFQARQVTNALLDEAELVLTMTLRQRSWIAEDDPAVVNRAFTMKEFARLAARAPADDAKSARALVQWAGANRAVHPAASDATDDILDPYGHETGAYTTAFNEILAACGAIGAELSKRDKLRGKAPANPFADFTL
ncbi:MAG: hypothetical protein LBR32_09665, partial [Propionibacteriaceae bacterium]|nr:hypothetical protein [Propionibacteriaceae bacterium]